MFAGACAGTANAQDKSNPALPCFQSLRDDPRFALLRDKVALGGDLGEIRRLTTSAERPDSGERAALGAWSKARADCQRLEEPYLATRAIETASLAREHFMAVQALIASLEAGSLTYGEFGKRRAELYDTTTRRIESARKGIVPSKPAPHPVGN
jgi:hypothetical protein